MVEEIIEPYNPEDFEKGLTLSEMAKILKVGVDDVENRVIKVLANIEKLKEEVEVRKKNLEDDKLKKAAESQEKKIEDEDSEL